MLNKITKGGVIIIALVLVLLLLSGSSFTRVPVGSTGIMVTFGRVQDGSTLSEGLHFHVPFAQEIVSLDNRVQKLELNTEAFSKDIQTVSAKLAVNYRLRPEMSFSVYKTHGTGYEQNIIIPATHEVLKSVCAQYTAEELISKRAESSDKMRDELDAKLTDMGITVTDFNILDFDFSTDFINAVEAKQVAEQVKKKAATENETAIAQAEREKQVAIKKAEADAEKVRIEAEAKANAVKLAAEAEAFRLQSINENLTDFTIRNTIAENWDGKLPAVVGSDGMSIMQLGDILNGNTAPAADTDAAQDADN